MYIKSCRTNRSFSFTLLVAFLKPRYEGCTMECRYQKHTWQNRWLMMLATLFLPRTFVYSHLHHHRSMAPGLFVKTEETMGKEMFSRSRILFLIRDHFLSAFCHSPPRTIVVSTREDVLFSRDLRNRCSRTPLTMFRSVFLRELSRCCFHIGGLIVLATKRSDVLL